MLRIVCVSKFHSQDDDFNRPNVDHVKVAVGSQKNGQDAVHMKLNFVIKTGNITVDFSTFIALVVVVSVVLISVIG